MFRSVSYGLLAFFAIAIGLYPLIYFLVDMTSEGLLASKPGYLLEDMFYQGAFYTHISGGGIALLVGWSQFFPRLRARRLQLHRFLGKVYVLAVLFSGIAGFILSFFATGGLVAAAGFGALGIGWLFTSSQAWLHIRRRRVEAHRRWMIRSYALCFGAVTLRLWLPLFTGVFDMDFVPAYRIIAWLAWVPNLLVAELIIFRQNRLSPI